QVGDLVTAVDGNAVYVFEDLEREIRPRPGQTLSLTVQRDGAQLELPVTVAPVELDGQQIGRIGIASPRSVEQLDSMVRHTRLGPLESLAMGANESWRMTALQARVFWRMLQGQVSLKNLSG